MSDIASRTKDTLNQIKEYNNWTKQNTTQFIRDPLSLLDIQKPDIWMECVREKKCLNNENAPIYDQFEKENEPESEEIKNCKIVLKEEEKEVVSVFTKMIKEKEEKLVSVKKEKLVSVKKEKEEKEEKLISVKKEKGEKEERSISIKKDKKPISIKEEKSISIKKEKIDGKSNEKVEENENIDPESKHNMIIEDMGETVNSLSRLNDIIKKHAINNNVVTTREGTEKRKRNIKLGEEISIKVAPLEMYNSDYISSDNDDHVEKKRKYDELMDGLNQSMKDREKEFIKRTKGEYTSKEKQAKIEKMVSSSKSSKSGAKTISPKEPEILGKDNSSKKSTEYKAEDSHPYSNFYESSNTLNLSIEKEENTMSDDIDKQGVNIDDEVYMLFIKSIITTFYIESKNENNALEKKSLYPVYIFPKSLHTEEVKSSEKCIENMIRPLKKDLNEYIEVLSKVTGSSETKDTLTELCEIVRIEICDNQEDVKKIENIEKRGTSLCSISGLRLLDSAKSKTKKFLVIGSISKKDLMIDPKLDEQSHCNYTSYYRLIHKDHENVVHLVYNASHFWQFAMYTLRDALKSHTDDIKTGSDMLKVLKLKDEKKSLEVIKQRYIDLRTTLQQATKMLKAAVPDDAMDEN